ncbi:hypothetical protein RND71_012759 [Anisodus tanguticus]|uniref:Sof1-like protein domain-containing protein n=1 Tax=Anisodus tanguticus TaxID=243964 RepID=A0AAE1SG18_9SOLA|nr:hypothetical protein RND71_012759 [Anisodus tanguticus]
MRLKVISRHTDEFTRERRRRAVEYVFALNAAKLEKIFARPFVGDMDWHIDVVSCMAKKSLSLGRNFSGSMDGGLADVWDLATSVRLWKVPIATLMESDDGSDNSSQPLAVHVLKSIHKHLPKSIYKATKQIREMIECERRREERRKAHSAPGSIQNKSLRMRRISKEGE